MNMSQSDQAELWRSVLNGQLEVYLRISSKLKLNLIGDFLSIKLTSSTTKSRHGSNDLDATGTTRTDRVPVRLYIRTIDQDIDDFEDAPTVDSWGKVSYINRPVEVHAEGKSFTLYDALKALLPELFTEESSMDADACGEEEQRSEGGSSSRSPEETGNEHAGLLLDGAEIKFVRIQGIEPQLDIPFGWVVNNLMNPEHYLHICIYVKVVEPITI
ncbi:hypothetical protein CDL12_20876 [Handroanthus impetiginosus]|uniref:Autophagy protein 5 n=1 Tax=Handroanthus impetiginosus TaxID=429701 RepID=A0A2G9GNH9_9LAMI|nr:hypothetical protein CDL12_20876 [Handroanthus impetiginosus]